MSAAFNLLSLRSMANKNLKGPYLTRFKEKSADLSVERDAKLKIIKRKAMNNNQRARNLWYLQSGYMREEARIRIECRVAVATLYAELLEKQTQGVEP